VEATRSVLPTPALGQVLREHRLRSRHSQPATTCSPATAPGPSHPDVVRVYGLRRAVATAGLDQPGRPRLRFHDLRHTYASLLVAQGVDIAYVSRQLGHANITTTLNTYTHLFDHARNAETVKQRLEEQFGGILSAAGGDADPHGTLALLNPANES
jgi:integrase